MMAMTPRAALLALCLAALPSAARAEAPTATMAGARYLVRVGEFVAQAAAPARDLAATAREALVRNLAREARVVLAEGEGETTATRARRPLTGYTIDGRVRVVEGAGATRIEVSLLVQTMPGREYRFESAVTMTLSGGGGEALAEATRRAVGRATARCLGELARQ